MIRIMLAGPLKGRELPWFQYQRALQAPSTSPFRPIGENAAGCRHAKTPGPRVGSGNRIIFEMIRI